LQLNRFIFDPKTGLKKKLNKVVTFPSQINMRKYTTSDSKKDAIYYLKSILVHKGPSCYSGHYVTYTYDKEYVFFFILLFIYFPFSFSI